MYKRQIKSESKRLGFVSCGISKAEFLEEEAERLENWLKKGMHGKMSFMERNLNLTIPSEIKFEKSDVDILNIYKENYDILINEIDRQNLNKYVNFIQNQLFKANKYFNDQEPWKRKDDKKRLKTIVYVSLEIIRKISILLYPIIPESSLKALNIFNIKETDIDFSTILNNNYLSPGKNINKIEILFNKIKND